MLLLSFVSLEFLFSCLILHLPWAWLHKSGSNFSFLIIISSLNFSALFYWSEVSVTWQCSFILFNKNHFSHLLPDARAIFRFVFPLHYAFGLRGKGTFPNQIILRNSYVARGLSGLKLISIFVFFYIFWPDWLLIQNLRFLWLSVFFFGFYYLWGLYCRFVAHNPVSL